MIATNMWSDVTPEIGEKRERELASSELFFKPALDVGARMMRHDNTVESAHSIVREILGSEPKPLNIQREIVQEGKTLVETDVGVDLREALEKQSTEHKAELDNLKVEMDNLITRKDERHRVEVHELTSTVNALQDHLEKIESESRALRDELSAYDEKLRALTETMDQRERELRELQNRTSEQRAKLAEMETALQNANNTNTPMGSSNIRRLSRKPSQSRGAAGGVRGNAQPNQEPRRANAVVAV